jgi:hypothetical protein
MIIAILRNFVVLRVFWNKHKRIKFQTFLYLKTVCIKEHTYIYTRIYIFFFRHICQTYPINHVFVCNPSCNTIFAFTNIGISRVSGGVRSRERQGGVSMVSIQNKNISYSFVCSVKVSN